MLMVCVPLQQAQACVPSAQAAVIDPGDLGVQVIHQLVAYALYITPVLFMWEKLIHTHDKPLWIRLPSRLPVGLFVVSQSAPPTAGSDSASPSCGHLQTGLSAFTAHHLCSQYTSTAIDLTIDPLQWFIAVLLPFYNIINAIMGALGNSMTAFAIPGAAHLWVFWRASARKEAVKPPS